jgi:hypothetical protein
MNQRQHERAGAGFPVEVALPTGVVVAALGNNISRGGLEIQWRVEDGAELTAGASPAVTEGVEITVQMNLPFMTRSSVPVSLRTSVVHVSRTPDGGYRAGLKFIGASRETADSIEAFVLERMRYDGS